MLVAWFVLEQIFSGFRSAGQTKQDVRGFPQFLQFENFSAAFFSVSNGPNKSKEKEEEEEENTFLNNQPQPYFLPAL